jgi:hypothetical protein
MDEARTQLEKIMLTLKLKLWVQRALGSLTVYGVKHLI